MRNWNLWVWELYSMVKRGQEQLFSTKHLLQELLPGLSDISYCTLLTYSLQSECSLLLFSRLRQKSKLPLGFMMKMSSKISASPQKHLQAKCWSKGWVSCTQVGSLWRMSWQRMSSQSWNWVILRMSWWKWVMSLSSLRKPIMRSPIIMLSGYLLNRQIYQQLDSWYSFYIIPISVVTHSGSVSTFMQNALISPFRLKLDRQQ